MPPLNMVEAMVDQVAAKCAARAKTGARSSEVYTPYAVDSFDTERSLSNGCVQLSFYVWGCMGWVVVLRP